MPDDPKVPINAKIPNSLNLKILESVKLKKYNDKTDCIIQALEKLLNNTEEGAQDNINILQEKENEIQNLQSEIQTKYSVIQSKDTEIQNYKNVLQNKEDEIHRLQGVLQEAPDPLELVKLKERNEGLNLLIEEKNKRIEELTQYKEDMGVFANYFKSHEPKKQIEASAEERKKPWYKFW